MPDLSNSRTARTLGGALTVASALAGLAACGNSGSPAPAPATARTSPPAAAAQATASSQAPVPAESHPAGDIPDSTVYVPYETPAGHLQVKVPEGWSRTTKPASATFASNLNSISLAWMPMTAAPTVRSARAATVPELQKSSQAFRLGSVRAVSLPGGPAVEIMYRVNSSPNPVTGRQYRLVVERFEFYRHGQGAVLSLSSAVGSDNVDPWRIVSESLRWK
jgi:hypothetical protein